MTSQSLKLIEKGFITIMIKNEKMVLGYVVARVYTDSNGGRHTTTEMITSEKTALNLASRYRNSLNDNWSVFLGVASINNINEIKRR